MNTRDDQIHPQSIEEIIPKSDLINLSKEIAKVDLDQIVAAAGIDQLLEQIEIFYNTNEDNIKNYKIIEDQLISLLITTLEKASKKHYKVTGKLKPLLSVLFYMVGTCQWAQGKDTEAEMSFDDASYYSRSEENFLSIIALSSFCLWLKNPTVKELAEAKYYLPRLSPLNKSVHRKEKPQLKKFFDFLYDKFNESDFNKSDLSKPALTSEFENIISEVVDVNNIDQSILKITLKIEKLWSLNQQEKDISVKQYQKIANLIINTHQRLRIRITFTDLMMRVLSKIKKSSKHINELDYKLKQLVSIMAYVRSANPQYQTLIVNQQLFNKISKIWSINFRNQNFKNSISNKEFILDATLLANPDLLELYNAVLVKDKTKAKECRRFISENQLHSRLDNKTNPYKNVYTDCSKYIDTLYEEAGGSVQYISNKYGPILALLYYIAGLSMLAQYESLTDIKLKEKEVDEGLDHASKLPNLKMADHYRLLRAYIRANNCNLHFEGLKIYHARSDLNEISRELRKTKLFKTINDDVNEYSKQFPATNLAKNPEVENLLIALKKAILEDQYLDVENLQDKYEDIDKKITHPDLKEDYKFWMCIWYFKLENQAKNDKEKKIYNDALISYLKDLLQTPSDLIRIQTQFKEILTKIYGSDDKKYIKLFHSYTCIQDLNTGEMIAESAIINHLISHYCADQTLANHCLFKNSISNREFVNQATKLVELKLLELCNKITHKDKAKESRQFLHRLIQLSENKTNKTDPYKNLHSDCDKYLATLYQEGSVEYISKQYGPILSILNYINSLSMLGARDDLANTPTDEMLSIEGLFISNSGIKDDYHLLLAYIRSNNSNFHSVDKLHAALADLEQISGKLKNEKLFKIIKNDLSEYNKKYPSVNLEKNPQIDNWLMTLSEKILKDKCLNLQVFQAQYAEYDKKMTHDQKFDYHFWMSIGSFRSYHEVEGNEEKKNYSAALLGYLQHVLFVTHDYISTLLKFKNIISTLYNHNKNHLKSFYEFIQQIGTPDKDKRLYKNFMIEQIYYNDMNNQKNAKNSYPINKNGANEKTQFTHTKPLNSPISSGETQAKKRQDRELERKREEEERQAKAAKLKAQMEEQHQAKKNENKARAEQARLLADQNAKLKAIEDKNNKKLEQQRRAEKEAAKRQAKVLKRMAEEQKKLKTEAQDKKLQVEKARMKAAEEKEHRIEEERRQAEENERRLNEQLSYMVEKEKQRMRKQSSAYLERFFNSKELNLLYKIAYLLKKHHCRLVFKGSFVYKLHANSAIEIHDIDAVIKTGPDFRIQSYQYKELLYELQDIGFTTRKNTSKYSNLEIRLNCGLTFEISIYRDITDLNLHHKYFISLMNGEAGLDFSDTGEPFLEVNDQDEAFNLVCKEGKMTLDKPTLQMTCCLFRYYKCKEYPVEITNLTETDAAFIKRYQESLASADPIIKNILYLELLDFKTNNVLTHKNAAPFLKLNFKVLLEAKSIECSDEKLDVFIEHFCSWDKVLNDKNKLAFKKQVDLIISLYFEVPSEAKATAILNQIKTLNGLPITSPFLLFGPSFNQQPQENNTNMPCTANTSNNPH